MSLLDVLLGTTRTPDEEALCSDPSPTSPPSPPDLRRGPEARSGREEAQSLIQTCKEYGIGLRLEPDGTVVVESNGKAWRALVRDLEKNVDQVAELIALGWDGTDT
jgi:hypothetical protein